jgi:signal transduction histidine kinase
VVDPRWRTVLTVTPYVVLGVLVAYTVIAQWGDTALLAPVLVLCGITAVWILLWRDLRLPGRDRPVPVAIFMIGMIVLNLLLVLEASWFGFLAIATFSFAYSIVAWPWELAAVGATAIVAGIAQSHGMFGDAGGFAAAIGVIVLNVVAMCGLSWGLFLAQRQMNIAATEGERARLAREIHDTLAQGFAGIVTQLQAADEAVDAEDARRHTDSALALAREGLSEARRSVQALRPVALDAVRLPDALRNVATAWSTRTGVPVVLETSGDGSSMSTDAEVALLRTAQEALSNIERHADAHAVRLILSAGAECSRLEVLDDGRGFDPAHADAAAAIADAPVVGGFGLIAMRERLASVSGVLTIDSAPGRGTAVRAEVPA